MAILDAPHVGTVTRGAEFRTRKVRILGLGANFYPYGRAELKLSGDY